MFTKILAIAFLAVRAAIRSRLFISLIIVLTLIIFGLPLTIKGDGTSIGQVTILLYYTLGLAAIALGTATVWVSCGAISQEIEDKHIRLIAVKPVHQFQVWIGKWLGLLFINAVLLGLTGAATYTLLLWKIRPANITAEERRVLYEKILVGKRQIQPHSDASIDKDVHDLLNLLIKEGKVNVQMPHSEAFSLVKKQLLARRSVVAPGETKQWLFNLPESLSKKLRHTRYQPKKSNSPVSIQFSFSSADAYGKHITGTWSVAPAPESRLPNEMRTENAPTDFVFQMKKNLGGIHQFSIPVSAITPGKPFVVRFTNAGRDESGIAVFKPGKSIELLVRESTFESNLVRTIFIIFCYLALLAALGLTASTFFSFPVATFVVSSLLAIFMLTHYSAFASLPEYGCEHHHGHGPEPEKSIFETVSQHVVNYLEIVVGPAMRLQPLGRLSSGILVPWTMAARALMLLGIVYPGILGLVGGYVLKRRELALPGSRGS